MTYNSSFEEIIELMDHDSNPSSSYLKDVGEIKRVLEHWTITPNFKEDYENNPIKALESIGIDRSTDEIDPFIYPELAIQLRKDEKDNNDKKYPLSVRRYRGFIKEKIKSRGKIRRDMNLSNKKFEIWRNRQIHRCIGELGAIKGDALVHAPLAFELTSGCSVGCWFCAIDAKKLKKNWRYSPKNKELWNETLKVVKKTIGDGTKQGVCYWATEPFDNLDYEKFIVDFTNELGRCPQTTTAVSTRNIDRLRKFLKQREDLNSEIDRFSILSLEMMEEIHNNFTPEELVYIELIPQNPEAIDKYKKASSGRAREDKEEEGSTIACISGFIINMPEQKIELITPCPSSEDWPLGHWILGEESFKDTQELELKINKMIDTLMNPYLDTDMLISFRPDITWTLEEEKHHISSKWISMEFGSFSYTKMLLELISEKKHTVFDICLLIEEKFAVDTMEILAILNEYYSKGLFHEDPVFLKNR